MLGNLGARIQKGLGCAAVLADCAHALGAQRWVNRAGSGKMMAPEWRRAGCIAHFSSFSFHAVKNLTTAEGGASMWCLPPSVYAQGVTDEELYRMFQMLSLHGHSRDAMTRSQMNSWEYDIIGPWYKCNMTDLSASMGLAQLERYEEMLERRREIVSCYDACCDELGVFHLIHQTDTMCSNRHLYMIRVPEWNESERLRLWLDWELPPMYTINRFPCLQPTGHLVGTSNVSPMPMIITAASSPFRSIPNFRKRMSPMSVKA